MIELVLKYYPVVVTILVVLIVLFSIFRIIRDTHNTPKTLAYLLLVIVVPVAGSIFYFSFGINYRKEKMFSKKVIANNNLFRQIESRIKASSQKIVSDHAEELADVGDLIRLLMKDSKAPLSFNTVTLLLNGEEKFKEVFDTLEKAEHFIHLEYYIVEQGKIADRLFEILIRKARQGVTVRFIYDDFGSHGIKRTIVPVLKNAGIEVHPFYSIKLFFLANRLNYRDHRKIIIVDGKTGFIGGINISDRYVNDGTNKLYWRDTHVKIEGPAVNSLQYNFIANWNFCTGKRLEVDRSFFPLDFSVMAGKDLVQINAGGPDYPNAGIMLSYFTAIVMAKERVYITSPYFIPNESIFDALKKAALSGKDVRLLLPGISDSRVVNAAARSYFREMLFAGVKIYLYKKGFVHAKTMLVDDMLSLVGTANMDVRSFDLNFEINAVVYSKRINEQLQEAFLQDIKDSDEVTLQQWLKRGRRAEFIDSCARLLSPLL
ncbi:MAG: cardiolipin synthase [Chitinophagaceae bacterium]|nr:cardiolipin synthase [Chitinophagaceae bacterium]